MPDEYCLNVYDFQIYCFTSVVYMAVYFTFHIFDCVCICVHACARVTAMCFHVNVLEGHFVKKKTIHSIRSCIMVFELNVQPPYNTCIIIIMFKFLTPFCIII